MARKNTDSRNDDTKKVAAAVGIGLGVAAAAAAGAYFLYGKQGARARRKVKGWMLRAKGEVLDRMESMKDISQPAYNAVVDEVVKRYRGLKNIEPGEVMAMAQELKSHWNSISRDIRKGANKSAQSRGSKSARRTRRGASRK